MDVVSTKERSRIMAAVRSTGNKSTEMVFLRLLLDSNISGWRRNYPILGKPDFVFRKCKVAVFVDGCFWHGCLKHKGIPATNRNFWVRKLEANKKRARKVNRILHNKGWRVIRIWEHDLGRKTYCISRILTALGEAK